MNLFYASFIPGLRDIIANVIKERLLDVKIHNLFDGAVVFETETGYDSLNFFCFNNIFAVIDIVKQNTGEGALEAHIMAVTAKKAVPTDIIAHNSRKFRSFRIVISNENVPASIDEKLRSRAERYISGISGLAVNRRSPDTEFWFLYRSEGFSFFMKRLTIHASSEKILHKGELPLPLAWTMCRLALPVHSETVLDPFCGYGSIPAAALKYFHIAKFIACDNNSEAASYTNSRFKKQKTESFVFYKTDFCELPSVVEENSIDVIVTDPPWGHYREINDNAFYEKMFTVFDKLLKKDGRAVVLCANKDGFLKAVPECFTVKTCIPILLSGKKTVIYQLIKTNSQ